MRGYHVRVDLIVTHDSSDFDAFGSMVAASKLYPGAVLVLGRRLSPAVRRFLSVHKNHFETIRYNDVQAEQVERLIVVDVRRRSRLRDYQPLLDRYDDPKRDLEVIVYDHHEPSDDDLLGTRAYVEPIGATVTLLIEQIRERGLEVDAQEATLMALGVYSDTNAFQHPTTSARDLAAASWLLERGASLSVVRRYLDPPFSDAQRSVLRDVLASLEVETVDGAQIAFAEVHLPKAVAGFAEVVSEALNLEEVDALFGLFVLGEKRVQVVARARRAYLHVGDVLTEIGGGGHPGAASAMVKHGDVEAVRAALREVVHQKATRPQRLADLMSSPVRTVSHDVLLRELDGCLFAWRHTGAPVTRDGRLVGMISRRDVERAHRDGRLHLPVSSAMSHGIITGAPDERVETGLERMTHHDIGRLPILQGDELIGIVTRTDLLRVLYDDDAPL